jgi:ABC-type antimicrobial peptide transport system permease subunit
MAYYMPLAQHGSQRPNALYIRASADVSELAAAVAPLLRSFDPRVRFATVRPLREILDPQARAWTLGAAMFTAFGLLALLVAAVGLYGVLAFDVAQRTRELGIRTALGAERAKLLRSVLSTGLGLGGAGVALGLLAAIVAGPFAADLLFQVSPRDPVVLAGVAAVLLVVSLVASVVPGLRATRVDPIRALRSE